ncbi:MAG: hypothetical protein JWR37_4479 [Mycobacterium sp.]|jgi:hypothetical protein|nr:hypothetical protein [Mycobacterium sp.]
MGGKVLHVVMLSTALTVAACGIGASSQTAEPSAMAVAASTAFVNNRPLPQPVKVGAGPVVVDTPPADADGNPACVAVDGWEISSTGAGISVFYWSTGPDHVVAMVRKRGGTDVSQSADIEAGQLMNQFDFKDIDPMSVDEVLIMTNTVRCFAMPGPGVVSSSPG